MLHKELLKRFSMDKVMLILTLMATSCNLDKDLASEQVKESKHRVMIRSLIYLTASRPDTTFVV